MEEWSYKDVLRELLNDDYRIESYLEVQVIFWIESSGKFSQGNQGGSASGDKLKTKFEKFVAREEDVVSMVNREEN